MPGLDTLKSGLSTTSTGILCNAFAMDPLATTHPIHAAPYHGL